MLCLLPSCVVLWLVPMTVCARYSDAAHALVRASSLLLDEEAPVTLQVPRCENHTPLVVGGQNASEGEFPHMVSEEWRPGGRNVVDQRNRPHISTSNRCNFVQRVDPLSISTSN